MKRLCGQTNTKGVAIVEYGVLVCLITVLGLATIAQLHGSLHAEFDTLSSEIAEKVGAAADF